MFEYMLESDPNDNCSQEMADEIREDYLFTNEEFAVDYKALAESYEEEQKEYDMLHGNDDSDDNL